MVPDRVLAGSPIQAVNGSTVGYVAVIDPPGGTDVTPNGNACAAARASVAA
jgi:hypothetical protein